MPPQLNPDGLRRASAEDLSFLDAERKWTQGSFEKRERGRPEQILPVDEWTTDNGDPTATCLAMAGRGWGKTKTGASWVRRQGGLYPGVIIHVIAPTYADLRGVIFEGPSGLKAEIPAPCIRSLSYSPYPEMTLWNGTVIRGFSSESPDRLRGPQATFVWGDELASWYRPEECLSNIDFSTRIAYKLPDGRLVQPQKFYTTTPRPLAFLAKMIKEGVRMIRGSTYDNRANLAESFFRELVQYEGTALGRQELHGELLDISEAAIIKKSWLKMWPANKGLPWLEYVMISLDTAFTEKTFDKKTFEADPTACTVWGVFKYEKRWNMMLLECWQEWYGLPDLILRAKKELNAVYGRRTIPLFTPLIGQPYHQEQIKRPDLLVIEDKGSGISLRQMLSNEGIDSWPYNPGNADKTARLHAVSHIPFHGRIWLPEGKITNKQTGELIRTTGEFASWTHGMLDELCVYSGPKTTPHDDWVDSCSQAWRVFADKFLPGGVDAANLIPEPGDPQAPVGRPRAPHPEDIEVHDYVYVEDRQELQPAGPRRPFYD